MFLRPFVEKVYMRYRGIHALTCVLVLVAILSVQFGISYTACRDSMSPGVNGSCTKMDAPTPACHEASDCARWCQFAPEEIAYNLPKGNSESLRHSLAAEVVPEKLSLVSPPSNGLLLPVGPTTANSQCKSDLYLLNASFLI